MKSVQQTERLRRSHPHLLQLSLKTLRVPLYNALCTYSLRSSRVELTTSEQEHARDCFAQLTRLDPEEEDRKSLVREPCYSFIAEVLEKKSENHEA